MKFIREHWWAWPLYPFIGLGAIAVFLLSVALSPIIFVTYLGYILVNEWENL